MPSINGAERCFHQSIMKSTTCSLDLNPAKPVKIVGRQQLKPSGNCPQSCTKSEREKYIHSRNVKWVGVLKKAA